MINSIKEKIQVYHAFKFFDETLKLLLFTNFNENFSKERYQIYWKNYTFISFAIPFMELILTIFYHGEKPSNALLDAIIKNKISKINPNIVNDIVLIGENYKDLQSASIEIVNFYKSGENVPAIKDFISQIRSNIAQKSAE